MELLPLRGVPVSPHALAKQLWFRGRMPLSQQNPNKIAILETLKTAAETPKPSRNPEILNRPVPWFLLGL